MAQEHVCGSICEELPCLSANHPWLVDQNLQAYNREHMLYTVRHSLFYQRMHQIPLSLGRRIWGCFHGWVALSNHPDNETWSLWNPLTSEIIQLPPLILEDGDRASIVIKECCLSYPPNVSHGAVFMLTTAKRTFIFCQLRYKRKKLKWVERSYVEQLRSVVDHDASLYSLTCCNGKVYALCSWRRELADIIEIDIKVKRRETVIRLSKYKVFPYASGGYPFSTFFLYGCCVELLYVELCYNKEAHVEKEEVGGVVVYKMRNERWKEMNDLKDAALFLDLGHDRSVFYSPAVASGLGDYAHFLDKSGKVIHSYDFIYKTIALSLMPAELERRLQGVHGEIKWEGRKSLQEEDRGNEMVVRDAEVSSTSTMIGTCEENMGLLLLDLPSDVLMTIMECCVGVEYLNFRATCKECRDLATPMVRWRMDRRMQAYSLVSPWLMVLDKDHGIISFTDPMGDHWYFIKTPKEFFGDAVIHCSMYGWVLIRTHNGFLVFFNPFTRDMHELPPVLDLDSICFSAPPTSADCMVAGFRTDHDDSVYVHFVGREPSWRRFDINFGGALRGSFCFATIYGQNRYASYINGGVGFMDTNTLQFTWHAKPRTSCRSPTENFLVKCDQQLLLVIVGKFGERVEIFKMNGSTEPDNLESLERHAIYICGNTCLCLEAESPEMANKIYFPRLHLENEKIVFYSLETRRYHTFNGQGIGESFVDFMGTKRHLNSHVWIEPSWS